MLKKETVEDKSNHKKKKKTNFYDVKTTEKEIQEENNEATEK